MGLLLWITIGFIATGFVVLIRTRKGVENKVAYIKANMEGEESLNKANSIIWWIGCTTAWGLVSMFLVVWCFHSY
ncbi:hypothetical protein N781_09595 [Pontibacillus halophilus JSM 076056 = DSM 19796]|uniref:Uncharacterized protein n=1 Tax=Pontibacillus halophilus JSM 076056 = DSM 19796 TaxID=1385510 RepID=A0A0A5HYR8_9BACI|nr:hypothetical protein [Pontibacillus halophilus]KGX88762.1 hypothetical protein N781_09595 [Pontibacillus halophilus JSM 076056 = DSM 19796]